MRDLLNDWTNVALRLRTAGSIALFLDFDGTLTRHRDDPEKVTLSHAARRALQRLVYHPAIRLIILSGRRQDDLVRRIDVSRVRCVGLHGFADAALPANVRARLERAKRKLSRRIAGIPGLWLEDKCETFALHYRCADPASVQEGLARLRRVLAQFGDLRILNGYRVWEVVPLEIPGKGATARRLWRSQRRPVLPVYIGNDETDEPAFLALREGITVRVGSTCRSSAHYYLRNPDEVRRFLTKLETEVR